MADVLVHARYSVPDADAERFAPLAEAHLDALAAQPGFVRGRVARSQDATTEWVLATEWDGVGSARRALSPYDVKVAGAALMPWAVDAVSAFEVVAARDESRPGLPPVSSRAR